MKPKRNPRFVIIGIPRTGTHALISALHNHPDLLCFGEIFHPELASAPISKFFRGRMDLGNISTRIEEAWTFANGFVIHVQQNKWAIEAVVKDPEVKIISTYRDPVDQLASLVIAQHDGRWVDHTDSNKFKIVKDTIDVNDSTAKNVAGKLRHQYQWRFEVLEDRPNVLDVDFNRINEDWEGLSKEVLDFLGVGQQPIQPTSNRLVPDWRQRIKNPQVIERAVNAVFGPRGQQ